MAERQSDVTACVTSHANLGAICFGRSFDFRIRAGRQLIMRVLFCWLLLLLMFVKFVIINDQFIRAIFLLLDHPDANIIQASLVTRTSKRFKVGNLQQQIIRLGFNNLKCV